MSKFKVNEKIRLGYRYDITDENDNPVYYVEGSLFHLAPRLTVFTPEGVPVAHVNRKLITLMPEFDIDIDGQEVAEVKAQLALFKRKLHVDGPDWQIEGDYIGHDYHIRDREGNDIARAERKILALTDKYLLEVFDDENDLLALCTAIAMDRDKDENDEAAVDAIMRSN